MIIDHGTLVAAGAIFLLALCVGFGSLGKLKNPVIDLFVAIVGILIVIVAVQARFHLF